MLLNAHMLRSNLAKIFPIILAPPPKITLSNRNLIRLFVWPISYVCRADLPPFFLRICQADVWRTGACVTQILIPRGCIRMVKSIVCFMVQLKWIHFRFSIYGNVAGAIELAHQPSVSLHTPHLIAFDSQIELAFSHSLNSSRRSFFRASQFFSSTWKPLTIVAGQNFLVPVMSFLLLLECIVSIDLLFRWRIFSFCCL